MDLQRRRPTGYEAPPRAAQDGADPHAEADGRGDRRQDDRPHEDRRDDERRAELYDLFMQAPAPICVLRAPDLVFEMANAQYLKLLGRGELVGLRLVQVLPEFAAHGIDKVLADVIRTGVPYVGREELVRFDRQGDGHCQDAYFAVTYAPLRRSSGEVDGVMAFFNDVTDQVIARRQIEQAWRRAEALTTRANLAIDVSELGTWEYDPISERAELSERARAILVAGDGEARSLEAVLSGVHRQDEPQVRRTLLRALDPAGGGDFQAEFRVRDGEDERWVRCVGRSLFDAGGRAVQLIGTVSDITEKRRAEAEKVELLLREKAARHGAEAASRAKDEFMAMLGHELRNPLSPIVTALQLMRLRGTEEFVRERTVIERQVQHLVRLVDDLLDVSRIARGKIELKRRPVDLAEVVSSAIEMASPLLEERHHRLDVVAPAAGLVVDGDEVRLAQVVANLLTNAAKYTDPGGRITLSAGREGGEIVVRVKDTGTGIPRELLPRIFDLFTQGARTIDRAQGGLGLGLTIVRSLVELHGGRVSVASDGPGRGSEFTVRLPVVDSGAGAAADASATASPGPELHRILVVDDNTDAAEVLGEALRALGHDAAVAFDGPSAIALAQRFDPHVALLDIGLPVMDGFELARRLRAGARGEALKLVAVTGYGQPSDRARSKAAGFAEHLVKPVDLDDLEALVARLVGS